LLSLDPVRWLGDLLVERANYHRNHGVLGQPACSPVDPYAALNDAVWLAQSTS
jgi:hypothetical protein